MKIEDNPIMKEMFCRIKLLLEIMITLNLVDDRIRNLEENENEWNQNDYNWNDYGSESGGFH